MMWGIVFSSTSFPDPERTVALAQFADQGVHRLTAAVRAKTIPDMCEELLRLGGEVIDKTHAL
jgi:hypothetical protein